jgi:hypothetical protein
MEKTELRLKEQVFGLFALDALLPVQYFERRAPFEPERRLMWAVLADAVETYRKCVGDAKRNEEFAEVESWILDADGDWFFSFENICATVGIDAEYLRRGLLALQERCAAAEPAALPVASEISAGVPRGAGEIGHEGLTAAG